MRPTFPILAAALLLAACGGGTRDVDPGDALETELAADGIAADPLLRAAISDPIMSDPQLSARSNVDSIRPPAAPEALLVPASDPVAGALGPGIPVAVAEPAGDCPQCAAARDTLTLGALVARQGDRRIARCAASLSYAAGWADRLPLAFAVPPAARMIEAAGSDRDGCALRAASLAIPQPLGGAIDAYRARATAAGYSVEHRADGGRHALSGRRLRDAAAYLLILSGRNDGGTDVTLVTDGGR